MNLPRPGALPERACAHRALRYSRELPLAQGASFDPGRV